jgi:hypothetical protein
LAGKNKITTDMILDRVRQRTPGAENLTILNVQPRFLKGSLYTVGFDMPREDGPATSHQNRVYVHGTEIDVYGFDEQLLAIVGATHSSGYLDKIISSNFVSSFIAITITVFMIVLVLIGVVSEESFEIPEFISSGWLLILGFYFGKSKIMSEDD